ncbi:MAG: cytochrome c peroxidase, partial [Candidatus Sulfotelmatobacter sp.]
ISFQRITWAVAAFERTLVTPDSAFDRYARGDKRGLTDSQKRGLILFFGKASCTQCHNGSNFTDNKFHSLGRLPGEEHARDPGRFAISRNPADRDAFKTPSLRNVATRSPYMHNGSISTLPEAIALYDRGGGAGPKSDLLHPLELTAGEKDDLLNFLQALSGVAPAMAAPDLPPDVSIK